MLLQKHFVILHLLVEFAGVKMWMWMWIWNVSEENEWIVYIYCNIYIYFMFARTLIYKEYLILISLHDSLFYSLTFQIHIHIHIFMSEVTYYFCNFCYRLTILLPLKFFFTFLPFYPFIQVSQVQKLMKLKELSLPTVAEELRQ